MDFKLHSEYQPTGDQPQAIKELVEGFKAGNQFETLLGVTGSGKTFTMANVIAALNKPTLIISHNKTLAGQLYSEMKEFFPENAVEYFVSYSPADGQIQYTAQKSFCDHNILYVDALIRTIWTIKTIRTCDPIVHDT